MNDKAIIASVKTIYRAAADMQEESGLGFSDAIAHDRYQARTTKPASRRYEGFSQTRRSA